MFREAYVTGNKQRPLLDEGCDVGTNKGTRQKVMIHAGREDHVTGHPAKAAIRDGSGARDGMPSQPSLRHGMEGMATDTATRI